MRSGGQGRSAAGAIEMGSWPGRSNRRGAPAYRARLWVALGVLALLFALLLGRLTQLQLVTRPSGAVGGAGAARPTVILPQPALRGQILAANGQVLVGNAATVTVTIDRAVLQDRSDGGRGVVRAVAAALRQPYARLWARTALCGTPGAAPSPSCFDGPPQAPIPLAQNVAAADALALVQRPERYPGVALVDAPRRTYPRPGGVDAAQVLGYLTRANATDLATDPGVSASDEVGRAGLEREYDAALRGTPGRTTVRIDPRGTVTGTVSALPAVPGEDLVTHLVPSVQGAAERALARVVAADRRQGNPADAAAAVVLDVHTGAVLAAASYPSYDPAVWTGGISTRELDALQRPSARSPLIDKVTAATWSPASTFKVVSLPAAFALGGTRTATYPCTPSLRVGNRVFHNYDSKAFGPITLHKAIAISCDTVFYRFAYRAWLAQGGLSARSDAGDPFVRFARQYGFGRRTGIDLPGEVTGLIPDRAGKRAYWAATHQQTCHAARTGYPGIRDRARRRYLTQVARENCVSGYLFQPGDEANFAIGQGSVSVTPIQLAVAFAAVANGGTLWTPQVGASLRTIQGRTTRTIAPRKAGDLGVPAAQLAYLRSALREVVDKGTARYEFNDFPLRRYPIAGKTGTGEVFGKASTAWFASFGPATRPKYAVVAVVSQGGTGRLGAAPAVRHIWDALRRLPPQAP